MTMTFAERHKFGAFHEGYVRHEFQTRGWEVVDERLEQRLSQHGLGVLHKRGGHGGGADFLVASGRDHGGAWLIDCKAYTGRTQFLPGLGRYAISFAALRAMETHMRLRNLPGAFVLGDLYVVTVAEVRDHATRAAGATSNFYWIESRFGRTFDLVFGEPHDGFPIAVGPTAPYLAERERLGIPSHAEAA